MIYDKITGRYSIHSALNQLSLNRKFDQEDEKIFCPSINKKGQVGHGLLKKYYIPHLGVNICEYCEIIENGEKRNLSYYQSKKLSRHLIAELQNWPEEIKRFQKITKEVDSDLLNKRLENNINYFVKYNHSLNKVQEDLKSFHVFFQEKLFKHFKFYEEILMIKDILDECKYDEKGKVCLVGIGTDQTREAKYIWLSLLFSTMDKRYFENNNLGLKEELEKMLVQFVEFYITSNNDCCEFVKQSCYNLLPEIANLEHKQVNINSEELIRKLPTTGNANNMLINQLKDRIFELEKMNAEKDKIIGEFKNNQVVLSESRNADKDLLMKFNSKCEELARINAEKDNELNNIKALLNQLNDQNNKNKARIAELEGMNAEKDKIIKEFKNNHVVLSESRNSDKDLLMKFNLKCEELAKVNAQKDTELNNMKALLNQLNDQNSRYKTRVLELEKFLDDLKKECNSRIGELEKMNAEKDKIIGELKNNHVVLSESRDNDKDLVKRLNSKCEELAKLNAQKDNDFNNMKALLNQLNDENNKNKMRVPELEKLLVDLKRDSNARIFELEKFNAEKDKIILELKNNYNLFADNMNSSKDAIAKLNNKIDELNKSNKIKDNDLSNLHIVNDKLEDEVKRSRKRVAELENILVESQKDRIRIAELERILVDYNTNKLRIVELERLLAEAQKDKIRIAELERILSDYNRDKLRIAELERLLNDAQKDKSKIKELERLMAENHRDKIRIGELEKLLMESNKDKLKLSELEKLLYEAQKDKLKIGELEKLNMEKDKMLEQYKNHHVVLSENNNSDKDLINRLNKACQDLSNANKQKEIELNNMNSLVNKLKEENNNNKLRINELETFLAEHNQKISRISELERMLDQQKLINENNLKELNRITDKFRNDMKEVRVSHDNLLLANKDLEAKDSVAKETIRKLEEKNAEISKISNNLSGELYNRILANKNAIETDKHSEEEINRLKNALANKEELNSQYLKKYSDVVKDNEYLKKSNESLKDQLENNITNYNILTDLNIKLKKNQNLMNEPSVVSSSLPRNILNENTTPNPLLSNNNSIIGTKNTDLIGSPTKSIYDSQVYNKPSLSLNNSMAAYSNNSDNPLKSSVTATPDIVENKVYKRIPYNESTNFGLNTNNNNGSNLYEEYLKKYSK